MNNIQKLENPARLEELKPINTLKRIGLKNHQTLCDIGAGSGIFTLPASKMTRNKVYALEISDDMLSVIIEKAKDEGIANIEAIKVENDLFGINNNEVDVAIMVTVLHEIENISTFLAEVKRVLKVSGKVAVIEFHKRVTPMGPMVEQRLGNKYLNKLFSEIGFISCDEFDLGQNLYCIVFEKL